MTFDSEVSVHAIPLGNPSPTASYEDKEREGRAVIIRDVTLQQQAFEAMRDAKAVAEQANRTKTQFMAGISHELRTPLGGIRGLTELLTQQTLPGPARRYVNLISQNSELLHDAIEDILDFSAIDAGRVAMNPAAMDLHSIVGDAFSCLAIRVADKPVRLSLSIAPDVPRAVIADAKRIRQVIVNIVGNAIKFTSSGQVSLRMTSTDSISGSSNEPHSQVDIVIEDTGIGVAPENQSRIFDAFEQADRGTNKRFGGTGLGLAIARGLAQRMNGGISLESEVGKGSRFAVRFDLPLEKQAVAQQEKSRRQTGKLLPAVKVQGETEPQPIIISVDNLSIKDALNETIRDAGGATYLPSDLKRVQPKSAVRWILTDATADAAFRIRARKSGEPVLWLVRAGDSAPRRAKKEDAIIIEPVHPDDLRRWLSGENNLSAIRGMPTQQRSQLSKLPVNDLATVDSKNAHNSEPKNEEKTTRRDAASELTAPIRVSRSHLPDSSNASHANDVYRLLVVDDSPTNRLVIHDQLVAAGHDVIVADGGKSALAYFTEDEFNNGFDCVLMDLQMPEMDGTEVTNEILKRADELNLTAPSGHRVNGSCNRPASSDVSRRGNGGVHHQANSSSHVAARNATCNQSRTSA